MEASHAIPSAGASIAPDSATPEGFEWIPCPGCGADDAAVVRRTADSILNSGLILQVARCNACN